MILWRRIDCVDLYYSILIGGRSVPCDLMAVLSIARRFLPFNEKSGLVMGWGSISCRSVFRFNEKSRHHLMAVLLILHLTLSVVYMENGFGLTV